MTDSKKNERAETEYIWSPEEAMARTNGVCSGCGGALSPIKTVDNADSPTHWPGCVSCQRFDYGVPRVVFDIASQLFNEGERAYSHLHDDPGDTAEQKQYYRTAQTSGLCSRVRRTLAIHAALRPDPSAWVPVSERLPEFTPGGGDSPVLIWCPKLAKDEDYPGHAIMVSNPEFVANGNAAKNYGTTHWMPLPSPPELAVADAAKKVKS